LGSVKFYIQPGDGLNKVLYSGW